MILVGEEAGDEATVGEGKVGSGEGTLSGVPVSRGAGLPPTGGICVGPAQAARTSQSWITMESVQDFFFQSISIGGNFTITHRCMLSGNSCIILS